MAATAETNIPFDTPAARGLTTTEIFALLVVVATFAAKVWVSLNVGLDGDEAYYAMWSAFLSPGYLDHPPGIAVMIALGRAIASETLLGVRLIPLVATLITLAALYRTGRLLVPGRTAAALAVAWYCLSVQGGISFVATPDAPSTMFWMLSIWAAAEAVTRARPGWWLAVGIFAGAGLASKYTNAWLGVGLVLYLIASAEGRAQLRRWQLWAGGALALVVFSPVLWWNYQHEWASFLFQGARVTSFRSNWGTFVAEFLVSQAAFMGPVLLGAALLGIVGYFFGFGRQQGARLALPVLTSLPALAYFLFHSFHSRVETNWTHPIAPVLALIGVAVVCLWPPREAKRWVIAVTTAIHATIGAALLGFVYVQAVHFPLDLGLADRTRMLRGWEDLASSVREAADASGAKVIWTESSYAMTGELFFHGLAAGDPRPVRDIAGGSRYDYIPAAERFPEASPALLVRRISALGDEARLTPRPEFESSRLLTVLKRDEGAGRGTEYYAVFAVSGPTADFPTAE